MKASSANFISALTQYTSIKKQTSVDSTMLVYFDESGNIKCISPVEEELSDDVIVAEFPASNVARFITGDANPNDFIVRARHGKFTEYVIVEKQSKVDYHVKLSRFITKITNSAQLAELYINVDNCKVQFSLGKEIKKEFADRSPDADPTGVTIGGLRNIPFYITYKNNPNILIDTITVPVHVLINQDLTYDIKIENLKQISIYTKKVFRHYSINI